MKNKYVAVKLEDMKEITGGVSFYNHPVYLGGGGGRSTVYVPVVNGWDVVDHTYNRRGRRP